MKGPGIIYLVPLIDRAPMKISTRLDTIQFRTESTLTKDNVPVNVDSVLYMKPVDLEKAVLQVENYLQATQLASQTTLREVIGKVSLNELLAEREKVGARMREIIDEKTEAWGIKVTSVEVRDVIIPGNLQDAMSRQAQAERERIARVTLATAEFEASAKMIEAAKAYESSPEGLRLRWMNILYELGQQSQTNTIMLIPAHDVIIPSNLQDAMSRQAQAERERMARVTLATAEFEASAKMIEAAKAYESSPEGLRLRWMNILYELGQQSQTNTIMLIPASMPEAGWPPIGTYGFKDLTMPSNSSKEETNAKTRTPTTHTIRTTI